MVSDEMRQEMTVGVGTPAFMAPEVGIWREFVYLFCFRLLIKARNILYQAMFFLLQWCSILYVFIHLTCFFQLLWSLWTESEPYSSIYFLFTFVLFRYSDFKTVFAVYAFIQAGKVLNFVCFSHFSLLFSVFPFLLIVLLAKWLSYAGSRTQMRDLNSLRLCLPLRSCVELRCQC